MQKQLTDNTYNKTKITLEARPKILKKITKNNIIENNKENSYKSSFSSNEYDIDKQDNLTTKKLIDGTDSNFPKIKKNKSQSVVSINKRLINDLNYQIKTDNRRIFGNYFLYKQTINLQELNDYIIYEQTKKNIENNKNKGKKNSVDFRIPLIYRRLANHYKREDLIPMKIRPKINLEDILIMHNSIFRKAMTQNRCQNYYLKKNIKLMYKDFSKEKMNIKNN